MRLGDSGEPGQAALADLARVHAVAGKFDETLAELEDVKSRNLGLRYISTRNRWTLTAEGRSEPVPYPVREVLDNTTTWEIELK